MPAWYSSKNLPRTPRLKSYSGRISSSCLLLRFVLILLPFITCGATSADDAKYTFSIGMRHDDKTPLRRKRERLSPSMMSPNDCFHLPGRLQGRHLSNNPHAGLVKCNALLAGTPERRWTVSPSSSALRSVPNVNHTVVEPAFIEKFELHGDLAWQIGIAAARDDRRNEQVIFVDKSSSNGMRCERRTAHRNIAGRLLP